MCGDFEEIVECVKDDVGGDDEFVVICFVGV